MTTKREYGASDAAPVVLYAKKDVESEMAFPVVIGDDGKLQIGNQPYPYSGTSIEGGGKIAVGTTPIEVSFTLETKTILISADVSNSNLIYVGSSLITSSGTNAITYLSAGDSLALDYDDINESLYVVGAAASQNFWKGAIR